MTKIFAISPNVKEGDEKMKEMDGIKVCPTTPQATFYPVTLPISSIVSKKRCRTSHLAIIMLSLTTISLLYYMIPDLFYKRVLLISRDVTVSGSASPWTQRSGRFDGAEENAQVLTRLDSSVVPEKMNENGDMLQDNGDNRIALNQVGGNVDEDGEAKQPDVIVPNSFETMKALATLLKIPGVQQVAVVQDTGRAPENVMMKPEIVPDARFIPPVEVKEGELIRSFRRAMREWLLRREMLRRRMLAELEQERIAAAERRMSQLIMELQMKEQQEIPQIGRTQPIFGWEQIAPAPPLMWMNNLRPMMELNQRNMQIIAPSMTEPKMIPPMQEQQQQPPVIMPPQVLSREVSIVQQFGSNPGKLSSTPLLIRDQTINRIDMEQKKMPVPVVDQPIPLTVDGTPDRDTIFKELRSRAQMQQQISQTMLPAAMIPPSVSNVVPPVPQATSDEIFRELQHRALRMQIEQDRLGEEQQVEKEKSANVEIPVLMIADTLPRLVEAAAEQPSEEVTGATSTANIGTTTKASNLGGSLGSLSTFFNFLEKSFPENEIINSPGREQEISVRNDDVKTGPEHSNEEDTFGDMQVVRNDEIEPVVKPDEIGPQSNFVQEPETTETPASMDASGEAHPKLLKSAAFSGESNDARAGDMLDAPTKLLETPQIQ